MASTATLRKRLVRLEVVKRSHEQLTRLPEVIRGARPGHELGHVACGAAILLASAGELAGASALLRRAATIDLGVRSFSNARAAATTWSRVLGVDVEWARHRVHAHQDRGYWALEQWGQPLPDAPDDALDGVALLRVGCAAARDFDDTRAESLLRRFASSTSPESWQWTKAQRVILELLLDGDRLEDAGDHVRTIAATSGSLDLVIEPRVAEFVASSRCLAALVAADVDDTLVAQATEAADAFDERIAVLTPISEAADWPMMLGRLEAATGMNRSAGATDAAIEAAEERLGASLPPTYRDFLAMSDGSVSVDATVIPLLLPARDIGWYRDLSPASVEIWGDDASEDRPLDRDYFVYDDFGDPADYHRVHVAGLLLVSDDTDNNAWLLNPAVISPDGEWEAWHLAAWLPGARRYRSFAAMVSAVITELELEESD